MTDKQWIKEQAQLRAREDNRRNRVRQLAVKNFRGLAPLVAAEDQVQA
jgi:hypothetical protein